MEKLASSHVAAFGIGGVGGYTVESPVRSGIGYIYLIDDDKICLTNINRQIYAIDNQTPCSVFQFSIIISYQVTLPITDSETPTFT